MNINFLIEKEFFSRRLEYAVRTIARRLGYPYRIIFDQKTLKPHDLSITYHPETIFDQSFTKPGIIIYNSEQIENLDKGERAISLFEWGNHTLPVIGSKADESNLSGWKPDKNGIFYKRTKSGSWLIPVDIFLNVFYHLSRFEERWRHFTEETATDFSTSILSRYQELKVPVVDVLIDYFDAIIRARIRYDKKIAVRVLRWPGGEEMGVALTHDVDITIGVHLSTKLKKKAKGYFQRFLGNKQELEQINKEISYKDTQNWNFPELVNFYQSMGWHATFFFLAKTMEGPHYRYNISTKKYKKLFDQLKSAGHEIALHPSKFAFDKPKYYREEKRKLELISNEKIEGMRQHFLRAKFPRLWVFAEKAAFSYDSSLGYNYQSGFRAGTSHPFITYDVFEDKPQSLTEFSLHLFEYNLPDSGEKIQKSKETISELIHQVSSFNGLMVSLFHPSNYLRQPYQELWEYLHQELKKKKIYIATLKEHLQWQRRRERITIDIGYIKNKLPEIEITFPEGQHQMAVEIIGAVEPRIPKDVKISKIRSGCYLLSTQKIHMAISLKKKDRQ